MNIGLIQASSQKSKNPVLARCAAQAIPQEHSLINFGVFEDSGLQLSYIEIALCVSLLLESGAVDFVITGCSSGQGMMLACNSLPGVICGYVETPIDAFLFGRINNGNIDRHGPQVERRRQVLTMIMLAASLSHQK